MKHYYSEKFRDKNGDVKGTWQVINEALRGNNTIDPVDELVVGEKQVKGKKGVSDEFCKYFSNVGIDVKNDVADHGYKNELFIDDRGEGSSMKFVKRTQSDL